MVPANVLAVSWSSETGGCSAGSRVPLIWEFLNPVTGESDYLRSARRGSQLGMRPSHGGSTVPGRPRGCSKDPTQEKTGILWQAGNAPADGIRPTC